MICCCCCFARICYALPFPSIIHTYSSLAMDDTLCCSSYLRAYAVWFVLFIDAFDDCLFFVLGC